MQQADIILALRNAIRDDNALVNVITALKSDNLIWDALEDPSFLEACIQKDKGNPFFWKPCNIALLLIERSFPNESTSQVAGALSPEFQEKALQSLNDICNWQKNSPTLLNVSLVAVTLYKQFEESENEVESATGNYHISGFTQLELSNGLKTLFAVLYGLVSNENSFFQKVMALFPKKTAAEVVTHVILTQPLSQEDQLEVLYRVVDMIPLMDQVDLVGTLKNHGLDLISLDLGNRCLSQALAISRDSSEKKNKKEIDLERIRDMECLADLFQLVGQDQKSVELIAKAEEAIRQWNKILSGKREHGSNGDHFSLSENPFDLAIQNVIDLPETDITQVQANALKIDDLLKTDFKDDLPSFYHPELFKSIERLIDLGLWKEGFSIFNQLQCILPAGKGIAKLGYSLNNRIENDQAQLDYLGILVTLDPSDIAIQREFANMLEKTGRIDDSYKEWKLIIKNPIVIPEDYEKVAKLAIGVNDFQNALSIGKKLEEYDPLNGFCLGVIGYSQFKLGAEQEGQDYLKRALEIDSDNPQTWLWSEEVAENLNGTSDAEQILSHGLQFLPNNPDLNYQLAKLLIRREAFTEALPFVRKAAEFLPDSLGVTLELLGILETLGLLGEEQKLLSSAVNKWPKNSELARINGRRLINMGKYEEALSYLRLVLANSQPDGSFYLELSKAIIEGQFDLFAPLAIEDDLYSAAETGIRKYLEASPNFEGRYYHAALLLVAGKYDTALRIFKELIQFSEANNDIWKAKIQVGIGEISLYEGQFETALISLKEASEILTNSIHVHKLLVEVYTKLDFKEDAEKCAERLFLDHQNDFESFYWFAGFLRGMGYLKRSIEIYERALTFHPENVDVILTLADCYRTIGEVKKCKNLLAHILKIETASSNDRKAAALTADLICEDLLAIELITSTQNTSNDPDLTMALSHLYLKNANLEKAKETLEVGLSLNPDNAILILKLSEVEELLGNNEKAVELLTNLLNEIQKAEHAISIPLTWISAKIIREEKIQTKLTNTNIYTRLGDVHYKLEKFKESLKNYAQAVKCDPMNLYAMHKAIELDDKLLSGMDLPDYAISELTSQNDEEKRNIAEIYAINAHQNMDEGNYDGAKALIEKALKLSDQDPYVRSARIRCLAQEDNEKSAFDEYLALKVSQTPNLWIPIAAAEVEDWEDSIKRSREYVQTSPLEARGWLHLAKVLVLYKENFEFLRLLRSNTASKVNNIELEAIEKEFEAAINKVESLSESALIQFWKNRGMSILQSKADTLISKESIKTPEEAINKALVSIASNRTEEALELTLLFPKFPKSMILRALCLSEKNPSESVKEVEDAIKSHPMNPYVYAGSAIVYEKIGNLSQSKDALIKALQLREDSNWDSWCSEICINLGDADEAVSHLSHAFMLDSENINIAFQLSELHLQMGHPELSIATWEKYPVSVDNNIDVQMHLAKIYAALGEIGKSGASLEKAIKNTKELPQTLIYASELMHECGDLQQAFEYARQALNAAPSNSQAWIQLSRVISQKTSPFEGLQILLKAEQKNVKDSKIHFEKARLIKLLYGENKALPLFEQTFNENPDLVEVVVELAEIYYKLGFSVKANEMADLAIKAGYENWFIHYITGLNADSEGQLDLAMKHLYESIKMNPMYLGAYLTLIHILQKRRDYLPAIQVCKSAIENLPAEKEPYLIAIQMLRDGKDYAGAEQILQKLLEVYPGDVALRRQLGALIALNMVVNA